MLFNGYAMIHQTGPGSTANVGPDPTGTTINGYGACFLDAVPLVYSSDMSEQIGVNGATAALIWTNERIEISLTFRPAASTSQANADAKSVIIRNGSKVELTGFTPVKMDTSEDATGGIGIIEILNTTPGDAATSWITVGDTQLTISNAAPAEVQLTLRKYLRNQASLATRIL